MAEKRKLSRAAVALRAKVEPPPVMPRGELATELDVTSQAVGNWLSGRSVPEPAKMARIEALLGIPMRWWVSEAPDTDDAEATTDEPAEAGVRQAGGL